MKCERVRESIADYVDGACGPILRRRVQRKIASCPCCAETLAEEKRLRVMLGTWADEEPSPEVWDRIRSMAAPALSAVVEPPSPTWRSVRLALGRQALPYLLGAATAVALMVGFGWEREGNAPDDVVRVDEFTPEVSGPVVFEDDVPTRDQSVQLDPSAGVVRMQAGVTTGTAAGRGVFIELIQPDATGRATPRAREVRAVSLRRRPARTH